jgi:hypothetical protein
MPKPKERAVIGWREWVALPGFGVNSIKVKVDTGARTSSLHAWDVEEFERDGEAWVRFQIHPEQRRETPQVEVEARLKERRHVRPSTGRRQLRPVVVTEMEIFGHRFPVELTLASRDAMGFRMLFGSVSSSTPRARTSTVGASRALIASPLPRNDENRNPVAQVDAVLDLAFA